MRTCLHELMQTKGKEPQSCKRRAFRTLLQRQDSEGWPINIRHLLGRTSGPRSHLQGGFMQVNGIIHVSNAFQCRFRDFNHPTAPLFRSTPSKSHKTAPRKPFHRSSPQPPPPSDLLPSQSQKSRSLPDSDIRDNYGQPRVQIRRSQYRRIFHNFRIHTVQTRIPHPYSQY